MKVDANLSRHVKYLLGFILIFVIVFRVKEGIVVLCVNRSFRSHSSVLLNRPGFRDYDVSEKKKNQQVETVCVWSSFWTTLSFCNCFCQANALFPLNFTTESYAFILPLFYVLKIFKSTRVAATETGYLYANYNLTLQWSCLLASLTYVSFPIFIFHSHCQLFMVIRRYH